MQKRLRTIDENTYLSVTGVAKGRVKADRYLTGATIINVYTGELMEANIAVKGKHIAYVGPSDAMVAPETQVTDLTGRFLSPGFIEPHSHPFQIYNPDSLARFVLPHGTTAMVNDNMGLYLLVNERIFFEMIEEMGTWPVKMLWSARLDPQTHAVEFRPFFEPDVMKRLLAHPLVMQAGELTAWPQLLAGDRQIAANMLETMRIGKRIEGHLPGASLETLSMLAAAGVTADHEAMTAEEALRRLRIGLWTTLRYSSLRPDLPEIVRGLADYKGDTKRLMMTTDGSTPVFLEEGYTDHMLRMALEAGLDPISAYQMVTINPATYYGLDGEIGGIAPGRLADILVLESLRQPTPLAVMAEGNWVAQEGKLQADWPRLDWEAYGLRKLQADWRVTEADFSNGTDIGTTSRTGMGSGLPIIRLENPAITRYEPDFGQDIRRTEFVSDPDIKRYESGTRPDIKQPAGGAERELPLQRSDTDLLSREGSGTDLPLHRAETNLLSSGRSETNPRSSQTGSDSAVTAVLFDRSGQFVVEARLEGMAERLEGLASSYTASKGILVMGQQRAAMAQAANRVLEMGGGIVLVEDGKLLFELELPVVGGMSVDDMQKVIEQSKALEALLRERGHTHYDPIYSLLFLTSTHLPEIRLTPEGVLHVKNGQILRKPRERG